MTPARVSVSPYLLHLLLQILASKVSSNELAEVLVVVFLRVLSHFLHVLSHLHPSSKCLTVIHVMTAVITGNGSSSAVRQRRVAALRQSRRTERSGDVLMTI